jgi:hypothetical protein
MFQPGTYQDGVLGTFSQPGSYRDGSLGILSVEQPGATRDGSVGFPQPGAYNSGSLGVIRRTQLERRVNPMARFAGAAAAAASRATRRSSCFTSCIPLRGSSAANCMKVCEKTHPLRGLGTFEMPTWGWAAVAVAAVGAAVYLTKK